MNSKHVYIGNYYSFPTPSSKYRVSVVGGFFDVFHEIFSKYREENHYRVTATSALRFSTHLLYIYIQLSFKSTIEFVGPNVSLINPTIDLKMRYTINILKM
jgi:hypothetical protein